MVSLPAEGERWAWTTAELTPEPALRLSHHPGHPRATCQPGISHLGSFSPAHLLALEVTSW